LQKELSRDLAAHPSERGRGGLMLVVIARAAVDLAHRARLFASEDLAEHSDFQTPASAERKLCGYFAREGTLACKRVSKGQKIIEQGLMACQAHDRLE
jgi:hypothetical protein